MDYVKPKGVVESMLAGGALKLSLPPRQLILRGMLAGAYLGIGTSMAVTAAVSPRSLPQSSTGLFNAERIVMRTPVRESPQSSLSGMFFSPHKRMACQRSNQFVACPEAA